MQVISEVDKEYISNKLGRIFSELKIIKENYIKYDYNQMKQQNLWLYNQFYDIIKFCDKYGGIGGRLCR